MREPRDFNLHIDDVDIAGTEWPGHGDPILLLHATGFHSRCWNQVVKQLPGRHIYAVDLRFHGRSSNRGEVDWRLMTQDIHQVIEQLNLQQLIGVGHSIGGHLIARAAARAPSRFKHLLLIDPVIMPPDRYALFQNLAAPLKASDHPVSRRKNQWRDANQMYERFKDRTPFSTWQPEVLRDYCDFALQPADEKSLRQLACDPINEASIYFNQQGNEIIIDELPSIVTPTTLLRAAPGDETQLDLSSSPTWPELANALPNCHEVYLPEMNHFIPMQDPKLVAEHIRSVSQALQ